MTPQGVLARLANLKRGEVDIALYDFFNFSLETASFDVSILHMVFNFTHSFLLLSVVLFR
jgi:hypothetical protein